MSEYALNDLTFTPKDLTIIPRMENTDVDLKAIDEQSKETWAKIERYEREFEERAKDLAVI